MLQNMQLAAPEVDSVLVQLLSRWAERGRDGSPRSQVPVILLLARSLTHPPTRSLARSLTHSLTHSIAQALTHALARSLARSLNHSITHPSIRLFFLLVFLLS